MGDIPRYFQKVSVCHAIVPHVATSLSLSGNRNELRMTGPARRAIRSEKTFYLTRKPSPLAAQGMPVQNLNNISLSTPLDSLIVITGLSSLGKRAILK